MPSFSSFNSQCPVTVIFLFWDDSDLNLDLLLGDYTASDIESDDDYVPAAKTSKSTKETATASACKSERQSIYQCPECDKTYSSVSGFRGHLRTKHSLSKITGMYSKKYYFRFSFPSLNI